MPKEQCDATTQAIEEIKKNPESFIPSKKELQEVIRQREEADLQLKESGRPLIV